MNEYLHISQTPAAQFATANHPPRCFWHHTERLAVVARYYQRRKLQLCWGARQRALVITPTPSF